MQFFSSSSEPILAITPEQLQSIYFSELETGAYTIENVPINEDFFSDENGDIIGYAVLVVENAGKRTLWSKTWLIFWTVDLSGANPVQTFDSEVDYCDFFISLYHKIFFCKNVNSLSRYFDSTFALVAIMGNILNWDNN